MTGARKELRPEDVTAVIDTREQLPYELAPLKTARGTLDTGDYSVVGLEDVVAVERKSLADYLGCIGKERERFQREMDRLMAFPARLLVIEASWRELEAGMYERSRLTPSQVIGSTLGWIAQGVPILLAGHRAAAEKATARFLFTVANRQWRKLQAFGEGLKIATA